MARVRSWPPGRGDSAPGCLTRPRSTEPGLPPEWCLHPLPERRSERRGARISPEYRNQPHRPEAALEEMEAEPEANRDLGLALAYFALGRRNDSDRALARIEHDVARNGELNVALVYAYRGDLDRAFQWLDRAVVSRDLNLGHRLKYDPIFDSLRGDPRYTKLLHSMNLSN